MSGKGASRLRADAGEEGRLGRCFPDLHLPEHQGLPGQSLALTSPDKVCLLDTHTHVECQALRPAPLRLSPPGTTGCLLTLHTLPSRTPGPLPGEARLPPASGPSLTLALACLLVAFLVSLKRHRVVPKQPTRESTQDFV